MVRNALNAKLPPSDWWRIGWWIIQDHYSEEYTSQRRPAKAIEGGRLLEKIIGCHSEKAVNDKIVKTSCGIKIPASEALSFSLVYFSLSFYPPFFLSFFLSFLPHFFSFSSVKLQITLQHGSLSFLISSSLLPWDPRMNLQNPFLGNSTLFTDHPHTLPVFHFASLHCGVSHCYGICRQSTRFLMGGKGKLN